MKNNFIFKSYWIVLFVFLYLISLKTNAQKTVTVADGDGRDEVSWSNPSLDFSNNAYLTVDVTNNSSSELIVNLWYNGERDIDFNEGVCIVPARDKKQFKVVWQRPGIDETSPWYADFPMVRGLPGNHAMYWRAFDEKLLRTIKVTVSWENHTGGNQSVTISEPYASGSYTFPSIDYNSLARPLFDEMGQYVHDTWDMKLNDKSELKTLAEQDIAKYAGASFDSAFSQYGGIKAAPKQEATGFFYPKKVDGKWWLVDPEGYLFWSHGITGARSGSGTSKLGREELFPAFDDEKGTPIWTELQKQIGDNIDFYNLNIIRKYGAEWEDKLEAVTYGRLKTWGLNTVGSWAEPPVKVMHPIAVVVHHETVKMPGITKKRIPDPFGEVWIEDFRRNLNRLAKDFRSSPWLIGVYSGNEFGWGDEIEIPRAVIKLTNSDRPARKAWETFFKDKYGTIEKLNMAWGSHYSSFPEMDWDEALYKTSTAMQNDFDEFLEYYAVTYYSICKQEVKKILPNHLYLGCRIFKPAFNNKILQRVASRYCDVMSCNVYRYTLDDFKLEMDVDRPIIIGEFHIGTNTNGVWGPGNGTFANDLQNAAEAYKIYVKSALEHPGIVGTHWFQYVDQMASGRGKDGENYRTGFVNITDQPYQEFVDVSIEMSKNIYKIRTGKPLTIGK